MNALIIDDEPLPAKYLQELLAQNCPEVKSVKIINDPIVGLELVKNEVFDIIFLDVEMPKMTGIEFMKHASILEETSVIYTTAYEEYALDAYKVDALYYLVKPIDPDELKRAIGKVIKFQNSIIKANSEEITDTRIKLFDGEVYRVIDHHEIIRLEADGSYTKVILINESLLVTKRLGEIIKELKSGHFIRCHNSHVVNIEKIKSINKSKSSIILNEGTEIPYSNANRKEVFKLIKG